jgi:parvulin-like peptidyl-prolyl isomerase
MRAHEEERLRHPDLAGAARRRAFVAACAGMLVAGCAALTEPAPDRGTEGVQAEGAPPSAPPPAPPDTPTVADQPLAPSPGERVEVSHILVAYEGAARARPTVTRTRDDARVLAEALAARARERGVDFAQLAKDTSDGPSGVEGGVLPPFAREQMVKPFSDAAFALRPGEVSGVVETQFGFHVILRAR